MKILGILLVQEIRTGGHVRYLELMEALGLRHEVLVLFNPVCAYEPKHFKTVDFPHRYRHKSLYPHSLRFAAMIRKAVAEDRIPAAFHPDTILIFGETNLRSASWLCRRYSCPLVFAYRSNMVRETLMNLSESGPRPISFLIETTRLVNYRLYELGVAKAASRIVFQSAADQSDFLSRNPSASRKTAVIRGDICQPRFKKEFALSNKADSPQRLLFIGTLGQRKGLRYLIEALAMLRGRGIRPKLDILAAGDDFTSFARLAGKLGISDSIHFRGKVADPFSSLRDAGLLVVPSLFDSYPNVVLEALHVGCPVVGSRVGGIPDMLEHDEMLFMPADAPAIADTLERFFKDGAAYQRLREHCEKRRDRFVFDWADEWDAVLGTVLPEPKGEK